MCNDLDKMDTHDMRMRLSKAYQDWVTTLNGSDAERFATGLLVAVSTALHDRLKAEREAKKKGRIYLSGPMRGIPEFNFPAFKAKAAELRAKGWDVFSPAEADISVWGSDFSPDHPEGKETSEPGLTARECLARDCKWICEKATHIYMMKGWEDSKGANAERALAIAIHVPVIYEGDE